VSGAESAGESWDVAARGEVAYGVRAEVDCGVQLRSSSSRSIDRRVTDVRIDLALEHAYSHRSSSGWLILAEKSCGLPRFLRMNSGSNFRGCAT